MQSGFDQSEPVPELFPRLGESEKTCLAASCGVAMNDSAFGGLIERRNERRKLGRILTGFAAHLFLQTAQSRAHTAVVLHAFY